MYEVLIHLGGEWVSYGHYDEASVYSIVDELAAKGYYVMHSKI